MFWIFGIAGYLLSAICAWTNLSETQSLPPGAIATVPSYPPIVPILIGPLLFVATIFALALFIYFLKDRATWTSKVDKAFAWGGCLTFAVYLLLLL